MLVNIILILVGILSIIYLIIAINLFNKTYYAQKTMKLNTNC